MKIRTDIIARRLKESYNIMMPDIKKRATLRSFRFYDREETSPDILYIMRPGDFAYFSQISPENAYIVVGVYGDDLFDALFSDKRNADVIYIKNDVDLTILANRLFDIFDSYNAWEREMDACPLNMEGLQRIIDCSCSYLNGSVILADYRFNYVAYSADWANEINMIRSAYNGQTPDYIVDDLLTNPEYIKVQNTREIFEYPIHKHNGLVNAYCYNVFKPNENEYRIRILYVPKSWPASEADIYLLGIFAEKLNRIYNEIPDNSLPFTSYHELRSAIKSGIEKEPVSRPILASTLRYVDWNISDTYQLLTFTPYFFEDTKEINGVTQLQLEIMIPHSCTILYNKNIVVVINLTKSNLSDSQIDSSMFSDFIRDHLYKVGASVPFTDFTHLNQAYKESVIAMQQGNRIDNTFWFYSFSSYSFSYLIEHCQSEINGRDLCIPGLIALIEYDKENGTDYANTLKQFAECRYNVTHTAEKLYLHRTTLLKHLAKIWEISGIDINNWEQRLHLGLSIQMLMK